MATLRQRVPSSVRPLQLDVCSGAAFQQQQQQQQQQSSSNYRDQEPNILYLRRPSRFSILRRRNFILGFAILLAIAPWIYQITLQMKASETRESIDKLRRQQHRAHRELRWANEKLKAEKAEAKQQEYEKKKMITELRQMGDNINIETTEYRKAEEMENNYLRRLERMETTIASAGVRYLQKLGHEKDNPLRVRVTLEKKANAAAQGTTPSPPPSFVIEMAPIVVAPHAASHFLRMVQAKLFDGIMLLHRNSGPSTIIHSAAIDTKTGQFDEDRFANAKLTELSFQEHSDDYPNEKYSAVFSGKGPHFYINMGGGGNYTAEIDVRESCFGKVVEGQEYLDEVMEAHLRTKSLSMLGINSVRIETPDTTPHPESK